MSIEVYISEDEIKNRVKMLAQEITKTYCDKELVLIGILNGAFVFCADLIRQINIPITMEFMKVSSYHDGTESSGKIDVILGLINSIENKHVLVVEDIVDTGLTIKFLQEYLQQFSPASVKIVSFLQKPARLEHTVKIDYVGFEIEDKFVIGYGLDFSGKFRELPYVGIYQEGV